MVTCISKVSNWLTLSSIYTHFNTLKKKALGKHCGKKVKLLILSNFTFFRNVFYAILILNSYISMSSAASLNLGRSQNGVLGNGLISVLESFYCKIFLP